MSYFKEIGALDRPFVTVKVQVGGSEHDMRARSLSAKDRDELEAAQNDEYGRLITVYTEDGEVDRVRRIYETKSKRELVEQIVPTRKDEATQRALEALGIDLRREILVMQDLPEAERDEYAAERNKMIEEATALQLDVIRDELMLEEVVELANKISQINVNMRAITQARRQFNAYFVYLSLYQPKKDERAFTSVDEVTDEFTPEKIQLLTEQIQKALIGGDLPFVSRGDAEPSTQPSSPSTSPAATKAGGKRTRTTSGASKRSTTPA